MYITRNLKLRVYMHARNLRQKHIMINNATSSVVKLFIRKFRSLNNDTPEEFPYDIACSVCCISESRIKAMFLRYM